MMHTDQTNFFMDHIQQHAPKYYRDFASEQARVRFVDKQERRSALLYQFNVSNNTALHAIFVKVFLSISNIQVAHRNVYEKHLLYPITNPEDRHRLHYTALSSIYEYFTNLNQKSFGAIRVLDYLPSRNAVLTEGSRDAKLRQLFWRRNGSYSLVPNPTLATVFQNVGTWLNLYHKMPKEDVTVRYACPEDYIKTILELKEFLIRTLGDESFFNQASTAIVDKAQQILPSTLPLGLAHGDFAQRNILIGPNARVTVLDTFAHWRTPIYQDIGYFLNDLKMSYPQAMGRRFTTISNQLMTYEQAFLHGYFEQGPVPYGAIRLYEALALLDKWSTTVARSSSSKLVRRCINQLKNPFFKQGFKKLLAEITKIELIVLLVAVQFTEFTDVVEIMV